MAHPITTRPGRKSDILPLRDLFLETVQSVCQADYSRVQINAWTGTVRDTGRWTGLLDERFLVVAECDGAISGFATLSGSTMLEMLYVGKDFQRQGVATQLFGRIEQEAQTRGAKFLLSDVSITARPFFERMGFCVIREQVVERQGVKLTNFRMRKPLRFHTDTY